LERRAGRLLGLLALAALGCVAVGAAVSLLGGADAQVPARRLLSWATTLVVLAPLVSLAGVALSAWPAQPRLGRFALGALLVTLIGIGLAR
jgi:hypothetical protein